MNPKKSPDEKVVNAGIGLPPNLIKRLDKEKGDHSRSKKAAIILREYFDDLDKKKRPKSPGDSSGTNRFIPRERANSN
jgi:metal-responsive CopG/Arc/MetJ family transcriptional regulator